jgi:hypothetical protein
VAISTLWGAAVRSPIYRPSFRENKPATLLTENERFELVFMETGSINSGTGEEKKIHASPLILLVFLPDY